ncbi:MAG: hypothetical protein P8Z79_17160 [Sedimentisphaerales bacterium]|jgi:hypothetical protein
MKRTSIFAIALSLALAGMTKGNGYYHGPYRPDVRWSFVAHRLVPNDLVYSPYAHSYYNDGLVPYWVHYSPYAHGINHPSGLVNAYACSINSVYYYPGRRNVYGSPLYGGYGGYCADDDSGDKSPDPIQARKDYLAKVKARREQLHRLAQARKQQRLANRSDGKEAIVTYLKENGVDFRMNRLLSMEGKVLSADFTLGDGRTVISFWDPAQIEALDQQGKTRMLVYQRYVESWKDFCAKYQAEGGRILQIVSADREEVLAQLTLSDVLSDTQTVYAMAQTQPRP